MAVSVLDPFWHLELSLPKGKLCFPRLPLGEGKAMISSVGER